MTDKESLEFLEECFKKVRTMSEDEIKKIREIYNNICSTISFNNKQGKNIEAGDILLCKNEELEETNVYLIRFDGNEKVYQLICLTCGDVVGEFDKSYLTVEKMNTLVPTIEQIISKQNMIEALNNNYYLTYPIKSHKSTMEEKYYV